MIFAQYASLDPSYVQHTSWSFWIDVGNGFTTLIPTIALSMAVTGFPHVPIITAISPRTVGVVAIVMNYQMLYGTLGYFANYCYNRYDIGASTSAKIVVFAANVIWILAPLAWIVQGFAFVHADALAVRW